MKVDSKTCELILRGLVQLDHWSPTVRTALLKDLAHDHQTFREVLQAILDNGSTYHDVGSIHKAIKLLLEQE